MLFPSFTLSLPTWVSNEIEETPPNYTGTQCAIDSAAARANVGSHPHELGGGQAEKRSPFVFFFSRRVCTKRQKSLKGLVAKNPGGNQQGRSTLLTTPFIEL